MNITVLIPAYKPGQQLVQLVEDLARTDVAAIVVVDDGGGTNYRHVFDKVRSAGGAKVHVVSHMVNLGKGAALKTGMNYAACTFPDHIGVVTADADGQHLSQDILAVARELVAKPETLVIGGRQFRGDVPLRSKFGNQLTKHLFRALVGLKLSDTQSGLRGIPRSFIPRLLKVSARGYEFELDMLITSRHESRALVEIPIQTVYLDDNASSHFNPLLDSMRIYFVLFRFAIVSLLTAFIDAAVFLGVFYTGGALWFSQVCARLVAMVFNYIMVKTKVFRSDERHASAAPKYVILVAVLGLIAYGLIDFMMKTFGLRVVIAKIIAESFIFILNFAVQREFVFRRRSEQNKPATATDWDAYYSRPVPTAKYSRKYTTRTLIGLMRKYLGAPAPGPKLVEIGGANSCFYDAIREQVAPAEYHVIDNNQYGLDQFAKRVGADGNGVHMYNGDVLNLKVPEEVQGDLCFSVGLIEHFDPPDTRKAIDAHFPLVKKGGIVIISFPTPTWLYRITRGMAEMLRIWRFPDERPLKRDEVAAAMEAHGPILFEKTLWPIFLTQRMMVVRRER